MPMNIVILLPSAAIGANGYWRSLRPSACPSRMTLPLLLFNISAISLKFGGMMHSTMEQIAI